MGAHGGYSFSKATTLVPLALILVLLPASAGGKTHIVGGSVWSLPPSYDFYQNWSTSQTFYPGDILYFDFETEMYNVHDVSRSEYSWCESTHANNEYEEGPALHTLTTYGFFSFVCTILDHCSKGLKMTVYVNKTTASTPLDRLP